ncbi:Nicotinamide-nucleotide adenylyltransferase [uncultured archaeon]|nr:Nicotinamide-nucleotide adenylyltransferase [uncultured archaeon]
MIFLHGYFMYTPKLSPTRGFMIESAQPIRNHDIDLVKRILNENDEVIIGIGNALYSHETDNIMTAGERIEVTDYALKSSGVDPNRYMIIPVENIPDSATSWVAEIMMVTPRWNTFYTRNFKNASMFSSFETQYRYNIKTIEEQLPEKDYYGLIADFLNKSKSSLEELLVYIPGSALEKINELGVLDRISTVYNRKNSDFNKSRLEKRALFLGGLQPLTGVYSENTGHMNAIRLALEKEDQVVIAIGSAQKCLEESDPLKAGQRIEVVRYALLANGIDASKFYILPIKDINENAKFASKVISLCPSFSSVIAGNDWTKRLFGEGNYNIIEVKRTKIPDTTLPISATRVRNTIIDTIKNNETKESNISTETKAKIESSLQNILDPKTMEILKEVGFYDIMKFLAFAKE